MCFYTFMLLLEKSLIMKKILIIISILCSLYAENFSEMSTQELIAIMGYVKSTESASFQKELKSRITTMNEKEKKQYKKNLKKFSK